jgi:hypothetical protein
MNRRRLLEILGLAAVSGVPAYAQGEAQAPAQGRGAGGRGRGRVDPGPPITNTPQSSRDKFAGMYKLVIYRPHGDNPIGRIYYDRFGRMGAMLHSPNRKALPPNPTVEDYRAMSQGLVAYYGTYDVDEATHRVVHHIEAASNPAWIGTDFMRWYELTPARVTLRTSPTSDNPLVWDRLPNG